jgi:hypothetical protein
MLTPASTKKRAPSSAPRVSGSRPTSDDAAARAASSPTTRPDRNTDSSSSGTAAIAA